MGPAAVGRAAGYHTEAAGLGRTSREEKRMTKAELVEQVADAVGPSVTKRECGLMVDAFLDALKEALARGDGIELRGFGTFKVRHRKAARAAIPGPERRSRFRPGMCRCSNRQGTSAAGWSEATACQSRGEPLGAIDRP